MTELLRIEGLRTEFRVRNSQSIAAVNGVSLSVDKGTTLGIVGESGCGKSVLSLSVMGLLPAAASITAGRILLDGTDIASAPSRVMQSIRGRRIAMVFQEPMSSLNPLCSIGWQIAEAIRTHDRTSSDRDVRSRVIDSLRRVRIPDPERRVDEYPFQMSGGMRQRVMIAMALACRPDLLIADEPTTALDVTVQAQILGLMRELQQQTGMAIILITHDLGVVAEMADRIAVMYAGRVVEMAPTARIFDDAQHPYTLGLLGSMPRIHEARERLLTIEGSVPSRLSLISGCGFHPRCVFALSKCKQEDVRLAPCGTEHVAACIRVPVEAKVAS
ncbi:MAG: ABC transporter ATP-binding protein [Pseudorhodoplanes sp.]